jgi:hypothetical protein
MAGTHETQVAEITPVNKKQASAPTLRAARPSEIRSAFIM